MWTATLFDKHHLSRIATPTEGSIASSVNNISASVSALLEKLANAQFGASEQREFELERQVQARTAMAQEEQGQQRQQQQQQQQRQQLRQYYCWPSSQCARESQSEANIGAGVSQEPEANRNEFMTTRQQNKQSRKSHKSRPNHNALNLDQNRQVAAPFTSFPICSTPKSTLTLPNLPVGLQTGEEFSCPRSANNNTQQYYEKEIVNYHQQQPIAMNSEEQGHNSRDSVGNNGKKQPPSQGKLASDSNESGSMVLVSKGALSNLTEQIAFSLNKMRDLEEQVKVIPELQRRLDHVLSDSSSSLIDYSNSNTAASRRSSLDSQCDEPPFGSVKQRIQNLQCKYNNINNNNSNSNATNCNTTFSINNTASLARNTSLSAQQNADELLQSINPSLQRHYKSLVYSAPPIVGCVNSNARPVGGNHDNNNQSPAPLHRRDTCANTIPSAGNTSADATDDCGRHGATRARSNTSIPRSVCSSTRNSDDQYSTNDFSARYSSRDLPSRQSQLDTATAITPTPTSSSSSNNNNNLFRSTQESPSGDDSSTVTSSLSPRVEYEDLINDLISLSYSVNYLSPTSNSSPSQHSGEAQSKEKLRNSVLSSFNLSPSQCASQPFASAFATTPHHNHSRGSMILNPPQIEGHQTYHHHHHHHHQQAYGQPQHPAGLASFGHQPASIAGAGSNGNHIKTSSLSILPNSAYPTNNSHGSLSLHSTPVRAPLDCGCQSIKEHLKYNTLSREQRLNHMRSQSASATNTISNRTFVVSPAPSSKVDACTTTDLSMADVLTRSEVEDLIKRITSAPLRQAESSTMPAPQHDDDLAVEQKCWPADSKGADVLPHLSQQHTADSSTSAPASARECGQSDASRRTVLIKQATEVAQPERASSRRVSTSSDDDDDDDDDDNEEDDDDDVEERTSGSSNGEQPVSLGSSYQDPSDFEEYCAYGESLDRRTKDFMSQTTKIPSDLRFALIRLNDSIKRNIPIEQIKSSSGCVEVIRKEWFLVAANKDSQAAGAKLYVDYFESFTKQLLNTVVNLTDSAGNSAMHYAASHYKMDVIEVLLNTKVCDVNWRNKAGYTPIMLLALVDISTPKEQDIARRLFTMGDVNIKDRTSGQTALMLAASHGQSATCRLLLECGADPSLQDNDGSTALMCGSEIGNEDIVKCLLAHKLTDPTAKDNDGLDAISIAMNNGHKSIGTILYAASNVPRMVRSINGDGSVKNGQSGYLGASLRRNRGKVVTNYVRRSDSLVGARSVRPIKHSGA